MFNNHVVERAILPAFPVRGIVPLPNNEIKVDIGRIKSVNALKKAADSDKMIAILVQTEATIEDPTFDDVEKIGVIGRIIYDMAQKDLHNVKISVITRCKIKGIVEVDETWMADVVSMPAYSSDPDKEIAGVKLIIDELKSDSQKLFAPNSNIVKFISKGVTGDQLVDILAYSIPMDFTQKLKYLKTSNIDERIIFILEDLKKAQYFKNIEDGIEQKVRDSINEGQKEYYLREKMRAIQDELGDRAIKDVDVEKLRKKILDAKMPKTMEETALNELKRYNTMNPASAESTISKTYLDFVVSLPWSKKTKEARDLVKAKKQLDTDHYGLDVVKDRILEYIAVHILTQKNPSSILCLVGPPGVGKTSLARSIAKSLNKEFIKQSLGGVKDESEIRGHRRTYIGALPGRILQGMQRAGVINPVFLLDEIDKLSSDYRGDPASAMLEVLDSEQNKYFSDHYLEEPYDLSNVFFIATANYLENIPYALRDRLEIVEISSYTEFEKFEIAKRHLLTKQLELNGLDINKFEIKDDAIIRVIQEYTKEAGVRQLERVISSLIRKSIKKILMEKLDKITINKDDLESYLGKPMYFYNIADLEDQIGVVTGLAYTQYGGDTLSIEVTYYKGSGQILLTGQLGDVMKESAQAALSYVKSNASHLGIDTKLFEKNDLHIHIPEGAVPKDGPSAGVTIATAITSAFTKRKVKHDVGMTGEVTLRGRVLPIGGLKEKSIAAGRSGLKTILIPRENEKDIIDIPDTVKNTLNIVLVSSLDEVFKNSLI